MQMQRGEQPGIEIDFATLQQIGADTEDPAESRLLGSIEINGQSFHIEAIQVDSEPEQEATALSMQMPFADLHSACAPDGPFTTAEWEGRQYVLIIYPFSN